MIYDIQETSVFVCRYIELTAKHNGQRHLDILTETCAPDWMVPT